MKSVDECVAGWSDGVDVDLGPVDERERLQRFVVLYEREELAAREEFLARWLASRELGPLFDVPAVRAELEWQWWLRFS